MATMNAPVGRPATLRCFMGEVAYENASARKRDLIVDKKTWSWKSCFSSVARACGHAVRESYIIWRVQDRERSLLKATLCQWPCWSPVVCLSLLFTLHCCLEELNIRGKVDELGKDRRKKCFIAVVVTLPRCNWVQRRQWTVHQPWWVDWCVRKQSSIKYLKCREWPWSEELLYLLRWLPGYVARPLLGEAG